MSYPEVRQDKVLGGGVGGLRQTTNKRSKGSNGKDFSACRDQERSHISDSIALCVCILRV